MLAPMVRQSKMGLRPEKEIDQLINLIGAMQNNRKIVASEFGGGLKTFGQTKEEFIQSNILQEISINKNSTLNSGNKNLLLY